MCLEGLLRGRRGCDCMIVPSNEHFWQVWLKSVLQFQRRRFKCGKLTDEHLPMDITFLHNVVSSTPPLSGIRTNNFSGDRH
jgi:hypothetical protein